MNSFPGVLNDTRKNISRFFWGGNATFQMCWVHHHREGQPERRNTSFAEAMLRGKSSIDGGGLGRSHRNAAQWLKVAPIPRSSNFHRSMAAFVRKKTLFPMYLSSLSSGMLEVATVLQLNRTEHPPVTLKAEPFDSNIFLSVMSSYNICKTESLYTAASTHRWVRSLCSFKNENKKINSQHRHRSTRTNFPADARDRQLI